MYLDHFGLNQPPFKITPNTEFFYAGGNRGAILDALLYAIIHGEGIVKVTGEIGSGKTMLCRMLESILPGNIEAIYLANPSLNRDDVFHVIASELRLATQGKRASETLSLIQDYLIEKHSAGKQVVLLVEEAQAMPLDTLEEIRLLSNLETEHHKLLQIVLFGQPELDENLGLPRMRQLKERITHSFTVPPLAGKEIPEYLMFRMHAAGYRGPDIFGTGAIKLIAHASQGITRRINVLADKALLAAFSKNTHNILPKHIQAAIDDSEFAVSRSGLPWKQTGLAAALLGLGIALGAGWQHLASLPLKADTTAPAIQTAPARAATPSHPAPAPAQAAGSEQASPQNSAAAKPPSFAAAPSPAQQPQMLDATPSRPVGNHFEERQLAALPGELPLKQLGFAAALLGLGMALGAGWRRHLAHSTPATHKADEAAPVVQAAPPPAAQPPVQEAFTQSPLQQRLDATQSWLAGDDGTHFTIQLMLLAETGTEPRLGSVLNRLDEEIGLTQIYVYPTRTTQDHQFGITFGNFPSREQAIAALAGLPAGYRSNRPALRTVKGIRDEIAGQQMH